MKARGVIFTVLSAIMFGATPILCSMTFDMGSNPQTLTFYRSLMAAPVLFVLLKIKKIPIKISRSDLKTLLMVVTFGSAMTTLLLYSSYDYIGVGAATTLHFLFPVFVVLLCRIFHKEKIGKNKIITLVIACLGMLFFFESSGKNAMLGIILALVSAVNYSYYMVQVDKSSLRKLPPQKLAFYFACFIPIVMYVYGMVSGNTVSLVIEPMAYLYTFIVSIFTSVLGVMLLQIGIRDLGSSTAAIFSMFEPITSLICGAIFLGESFTVNKMLGSMIIILAVTFLVAGDRFLKKKKTAGDGT